MKTTEAQRRAVAKFDKENTIQVKFKLNIHTDQDIIGKLASEKNKTGYIKRLIRDDLKK